jgi:hypothetical protein
MYAGHMGFALGAYGIRRTAPLWFLVLASQLPDWADAGFCLAGLRPSVPGILSHSFPAIAALASLAALAYAAAFRDKAGILIVAAVVVSHAAGDYFTGIKPTWPGGPMIGLQLYRKPFIDFILEAAVILGGWLLYRRSLSSDRRSSEPVFTLLGALLMVQVGAGIVLSLTGGFRKC